jgi:hypothetical protein
MSRTRKIWEQWDDESPQAFEAFEIYRDQPKGKRSGVRVGKKLGKSAGLIERWSSKYQWKKRSQAWDDEETHRRNKIRLQEIERTEKEETRRKILEDMNERHARQAQAFSTVISKLEAEFGERVTKGTAENQLSQMPMEKLLDDIIRGASVQPKLHEAERVARGVHPTHNVNVAMVDVTELSDEELARLAGRAQW